MTVNEASSQERTLEQPVGRQRTSQKETSEMSRAVDETGVVCRTHVGGQALLEGIMMRGKYNWALAVRRANGTVHTEEHDLASGRDKNSWMYKPVVRGCTALVESLTLGYKALEIASRFALEDVENDESEECGEAPVAGLDIESGIEPAAGPGIEPAAGPGIEPAVGPGIEPATGPGIEPATGPGIEPAAGPGIEPTSETSAIPKPVITVAMVLGVLLGIGIFVVLPALLTNIIVGDYAERTLLWNVIDGVLRVAIFIFYIWLIGRMRDTKRMFAYHGAEHKTIHCYEHGLDLTVANARRFPALHVRCGTAFMLMTMIIAILVFTLVPVQVLIDAVGVENAVLRLVLVMCTRILLLPVVAGLSYEVTVKWAGSRPEHPLVRIILWPGLQMQRLTTNDPDDGMIECAIQAMLLVLRREEKEAAEQHANSNPEYSPEHNLERSPEHNLERSPEDSPGYSPEYSPEDSPEHNPGYSSEISPGNHPPPQVDAI